MRRTDLAGLSTAERLARREVEAAMLSADQRLETEIERLVALAQVNPGVRAEEIAAAVAFPPV